MSRHKKSEETSKNDGRNIDNYPNYKIYKDGRVYSLVSKKFLSTPKTRNGYNVVSLSKNGIAKTKYVHHLVAECFLNHKERSKKIHIDHIDSDKGNNHVSNLRIVTARVNISKGKEGVSGHKNITIENGRFRLCLTINSRKRHIGMYDSLSKAIEDRDLIINKLENE